MDKIVINLFREINDCDDCGETEAFCLNVESSVHKVPDIHLGSADCCSMENVSLQDGLNHIFKHLDINMPYSNITLNAFKKVGSENPNELYDAKKISYKHLIRYLNPRWKVETGSTLEETAVNFLKDHGVELIIKENYDA